MSADSDIYLGSFFNIERSGDDWAIWRITNDDGDREQIILTTGAMDDLRDYFAEFYAEDRRESRVGGGSPLEAACEHEWQWRDDLSITSPGGGYWQYQTRQCSRCGALDTLKGP